MKKVVLHTFALLTVLVLFAAVIPGRAQAASYGDVQYIVRNGQVTITGGTKYDLLELVVPETIEGYPVTAIAAKAFSSQTKLAKITLPDTVTDIGASAFTSCMKLTEVRLPKNLVTIGDHAFSSCSLLTRLYIPKSVISIGQEALPKAGNLEFIEVDPENRVYSSDDFGVVFNKDKTTLIYAPPQMTGNYTIPNTVTKIASYAFAYNDITQITIPDSVTVIEEYAFVNTALKALTIPDSVKLIGGHAFASNYLLVNVTLGKGLEKINTKIFYNCESLRNITIPDNIRYIDKNAFTGCVALMQITIPGSVTIIGDGAFSDCTLLKKVTLSEGTEEIGIAAFSGCERLTQINIPSSLTDIRRDAFSGCTKLETVTYCGTKAQWDDIYQGKSFYDYENSLASATMRFHEKDGDPCPICGYPKDYSFLFWLIPLAVVVLAVVIAVPAVSVHRIKKAYYAKNKPI